MDLIGTDSARRRGAGSADVVAAVEQVGGGDLLLTVGELPLRSDGTTGMLFERAVVRLTAADRDRLIEALTWARTSDMESAR